MNDYEMLVSEIQEEVPIIEGDLFKKTGCYGLYRNGRIYLEQKQAAIKKREWLLEEYAHFKTSYGNIINLDSFASRKQENQARNLSYEQLVSLEDLIACSEACLHTKYECAEFLGVSVETLQEVVQYYQQKFGHTHLYKGRIFEFRDQSVIILNTKLAK